MKRREPFFLPLPCVLQTALGPYFSMSFLIFPVTVSSASSHLILCHLPCYTARKQALRKTAEYIDIRDHAGYSLRNF
jgi:hypothetical protein